MDQRIEILGEINCQNILDLILGDYILNSHELTAGNLEIIKSRNMEGISIIVPCEQALWGALAVGQEKEGELATTSLDFEYLPGKS